MLSFDFFIIGSKKKIEKLIYPFNNKAILEVTTTAKK